MKVRHVLQAPGRVLMLPLHGAFPERLLGRSSSAHMRVNPLEGVGDMQEGSLGGLVS